MEIAWVVLEQLGHIRVTFDLSFPDTFPLISIDPEIGFCR